MEVYKDVLDRSVLVAVADAEGNIIRVNDLFCRRTGYPREELTGMDFAPCSTPTTTRNLSLRRSGKR
jgi:PAS domain S-box-containing protein